VAPRSLLRYTQVRRVGPPAIDEDDSPYAAGRYFDANCQPSDAAFNCVYVTGVSMGSPDVTTVNPSNPATMPAVGIIVEKYSATDCLVQVFGLITGIFGLVPGQRYFVGPGGTVTTPAPVPPATLQVIGLSIGPNQLLIDPNFLLASDIFVGNERDGVLLLGIKNGVNRVFTTPDIFVNAGGTTIQIYHNGRRLLQGAVGVGDYTLSEGGGPGSGYNTVTIGSFAPATTSTLVADYVVA
jgi:hypothetical protein